MPEHNEQNTKVMGYLRLWPLLLGLIIVLYFIARHLFPFIQSLF